VDRYVGLFVQQGSLDFDGKDSLTAKGRKIRLQIAIAARVNEDQFTLDPVIGQTLQHDVRLHEG
jgi:hypothetical protein